MRIYSSAGYKKFIRTDLRAYLVMATNFKSEIMAYFYNNKKLEQVILTQQKKVKMYQGVKELKKEVQGWKRAQENVLEFFGRFAGSFNKDDPEMGKKLIENVPSHLLNPLITKKQGDHEDDDDVNAYSFNNS